MADTVAVALFQTQEGAEEAASMLRANGIKCAVGDLTTSFGGMPIPSVDRIPVIVSTADEKLARDVLDGLFTARWFLTNPDGHRYLAFEACSAEQLRHHVETHPDLPPTTRGELEQLASLLDQHGWDEVEQAFHHLLRHDSKLEGRSLDEWAVACGCQQGHSEAPS
ncbi:MAG: hypothetical protein ACTHNU_15180 [Gaiellales bacterium]